MTDSTLKPISENRLELFGFSILWIVFFHLNFYPQQLLAYQYKSGAGKELLLIYQNIKQMGYFGVDIFFFLSGLGLITSWLKESSIFRFYKKRVYRIIPVYYMVLVVELLFVSMFGLREYYWRDISLKQAVFLFSGIDFFITRYLVIWFISAILVCYLLFPFIARIFLSQRRKGLFIICTVACTIAGSVLISIFMKSHSYLLIFTTRIPSFLIGIYMGYAIYHKIEPGKFITDIRLNMLYSVIGIGILVYIYRNIPSETRWQYGLWWYPCIFLSFTFSYCLSVLFNFLKRNFIFHKLVLLVGLIGTCSLEIFLLNSFVIRQGHQLELSDTKRLYLVVVILAGGAMLKLLHYAGRRLTASFLPRSGP